MTALSSPRTAIVALIIGAFAFGACGGGGTATAGPSTATVSSPAPTVEATVTASTEPTDAPETGTPAGDPADDLEIAAPYSLEPLDEQIAAAFVTAMEQALSGGMGDLVQFGFRSASLDDQTQAWVIVMALPDLPITPKALLDQISQGAAASGDNEVEEATIGGEPARIITAQGQSMVVTLVGDEVVMVIGFISKKATVNVAEALIEAN